MYLLHFHIPDFEHHIHIADSIGTYILIQKQAVVHCKLFVGKSLNLSSDIGAFKHRDAFQILRILLRFLICFKSFCFSYQFLQLCIRKAASVLLKHLLQILLSFGSKATLWNQGKDGAVGIIKKPFPDNFFKVSLVNCFLQSVINGKKLHLGKRIFIIIEPVSQNIKTVHQSFWIGTEISLAVTEFHIIDSRKNRFFVNSILHNVLKTFSDSGYKFFFLAGLGTFCHNREEWLQNSIVIRAINILTDLCIQKCFLQRSSRSAKKCIIQHIKCYSKHAVHSISHNHIKGKISIILFFLILSHRILFLKILHLRKWSLLQNAGIHSKSIKSGKIFFIDKTQLLLHVHISVKIYIAVGGMIIRAVEIQKLLIGKLRNILRVASGFHAISIIREKAALNLPVQNLVRGRKCPLHLIVYNAIVGQRTFFILKMIAPAFLTEDFFFLIDIGIKNSIQIHMHQVLEILVIAACYRIAGLVRVGHGI